MNPETPQPRSREAVYSWLHKAAWRVWFASSKVPPVIWYLLLGVYAVALASRGQPGILEDDAAITLRYAARLAAGKGFTYNDHEHVLGASNPLYTLVLTVLQLAGTNVETAARALGVATFVGTTLLAALIASRLSTLFGGFLTGLLLASQPLFRSEALGGMEAGLAACLGLAVVLAALEDRTTLASVFLGLAVWNKLDAGMLALGVVAAWLIVRRALPVRVAAISFAVVLPWFAFASYYFGSPLPHSMIAKLANSTGNPPDRLWATSFIAAKLLPVVVLAAAMFFPSVWRTLGSRLRLATLILAGWFLFHWLALSVLWLGDVYPWYLTVLCPPAIILGCAAGVRVLRLTRPRRSGLSLLKPLIVVGLLLLAGVPGVRSLVSGFPRIGGRGTQGWAFDFDRRLAGRFLGRYADPSEVVGSNFGWVAYEIANPFNDYSQLNSREMRSPQKYWVSHGVPYDEGCNPPAAPSGYVPLATFDLTSDLYPGYSWFTVFGTPDSSVARSGKRLLQLRLFELAAPQPFSPQYGLGNVHLVGTDLQAHPPSGATFVVENRHQPVHLVFTPAFDLDVPADKTDGATFEIMAKDKRVYHRHLLPQDRVSPVVLALDAAEEVDQLPVAFITTPGPRGNRDYDWINWRNVKVVIGDSYVEMPQAVSADLVREWAKYNPTPIR